ncbi:scavenger receptor cysteine-rich domain-containing group B protein isoform 2-T2 [Anableps anableps]
MLRFVRIILTGLLGVLCDGVGAFGVGTYGGVRVVNGDHHCSGRVEVNLHEKWGTICDHDWNMHAASVVCSELGCGFAESASHGAEFGPGGGVIALRSVHCKGHESSLIHCDVFINRNSFCTHQNDAGVKCSGTLMEPRLSVLSPHFVFSAVDLLTPQHWYNTSSEAPTGSVIKGESFNITCSTPRQYPGASFQLRLVRSNGTVRQSLPAVSQSVTFTFPNAQSSNEGYYYCLYRVQLGGRTFVSRESQPLPIAIKDPEPLLSPMVISWLVSGVTFVIAVIIIFTVAKVVCNKEKKPSELERETRTCVDNTYVALAVNKL